MELARGGEEAETLGLDVGVEGDWGYFAVRLGGRRRGGGGAGKEIGRAHV